MILGIMQPYFFPYPGYFSLIKATNKWIVFDTPQYKKYSWFNRNRIIKPNCDDWMYIIVPVKSHKLQTPINNIKIDNSKKWEDKIIAQLGHYKRNAPYYKRVVEFLIETLNHRHQDLSRLNVFALQATCDYLGIDFNFEIFSEMNIHIDMVDRPDDWALHICKSLGASNYINAEGGQSFFEKEKFKNNNIRLRFLKFKLPLYDQKIKTFLPGLSIIDAMMFNSPEEINQMLDEYYLLS